MKLLVIATLFIGLLLLGCTAKQQQPQKAPITEEEVKSIEEVENLSKELQELDQIEEEINLTELDTIDLDLGLE